MTNDFPFNKSSASSRSLDPPQSIDQPQPELPDDVARTVPETTKVLRAVDAATIEPININIPGGFGSGNVDGVAVASGMRILVKDQIDATQNGVYKLTEDESKFVFERDQDFGAAAEETDGIAFVIVPVQSSGGVNGNKGFLLVRENQTLIGTSEITFNEIEGWHTTSQMQ